ncbi:MAG: nuclear transport factor 2 family protein [bacterium]|nr:MAG: nuclear transport factor 2 family protein [bacterium]
MKYLNSLFFLIVILLVSCTRIIETEEIRQEVKDLLNSYYTAIENEDLGVIRSLFSYDSTMLTFITDQKQPVSGWENIRDYFIDQFKQYDYIRIHRKNEIIRISELKNVVWIASVIHTEKSIGEHSISLNNFTTAILEKLRGRWLFVYLHISNIGETTAALNVIKRSEDTESVTLPESKTVTSGRMLKSEQKEEISQPSNIDTTTIDSLK